MSALQYGGPLMHCPDFMNDKRGPCTLYGRQDALARSISL
jgi:hypothetical protein